MTTASKIRIKLISRGQSSHFWANQQPVSGSFTGECQFLFDRAESNYDWLVVIDDVSRNLRAAPETLACADEHTLLVTTEPPSITRYGSAFSSQFAQVLTSQPPTALPHPKRIYSHTGNLWYNGHNYREIKDKSFTSKKTQVLSTVCSSKQQKHTVHNDRYQFTRWLQQQLPEMELYGHGSRYIEHKYDALDPYLYHLAIENYLGLHHWTEKLADPYLSGCLPIYHGCPNVADYFPKESFVRIDMYNRQEALATIKETISRPAHDSTTLDALTEAKRRVLEDYNLLRMIERIAIEAHNPSRKPSGRKLYGRKQMRLRRSVDALGYLGWAIGKHFK